MVSCNGLDAVGQYKKHRLDLIIYGS